MVCKRQEQCVFGEKCIYHVGSVLPKCSIFEQKPPIKQTEQEWLQTCTTEELAGAIYEWYTLGYTRGKNGKKLNSITEVVAWLKEKHDE